MDRERAKELLPIIRDFVDGKTVQFRLSTGRWANADDPAFSDPNDEYRIKPEPLAIYARIRRETAVIFASSNERDMDWDDNPEEIKKFIEVAE